MKVRGKTFVCLALAAVLVCLVAQYSESEPIVIKLATESAVGTPGEKSGQDFARLVEEKTNGNFP